MSLLRSTCDRCYAAKTRCTKEDLSPRCCRCARAGVDCTYGPRGQPGRPPGSTTSIQASLATNRTNKSGNRANASKARIGSTSTDRNVDLSANSSHGMPASQTGTNATAQHSLGGGSIDIGHHVITIADDDFSCATQWDNFDINSMLHSFVPRSSTQPLTIPTEGLSRFIQSSNPSSQSTTISLPLDDKTHHDTDAAHTFLSSSLDCASDTPSSSERATKPSSDNLHSRLAVIHHQLVMLSESLTVSFDMAKDVQEIYRASRDFKAILDIYPSSRTSYPPVPFGKCQGMTSILILGCYSYLMEAFELMVENVQQHIQPDLDDMDDMDVEMPVPNPADTVPSTMAAWPQHGVHPQSHPLSPSPPAFPASVVPNISVGSVHIPLSNQLTADIHKLLIHQIAQNLKVSLRQCVERMAAAHHVNLEADPGDESWNPIAKLAELGRRELQRREDGIFRYLRQGL